MKQHVCIVLRGVLECRVIKTARALVEAGFRVTIMCCTFPPKDSEYRDEEFELYYVEPEAAPPCEIKNRYLRIAVNLTVKRMQSKLIEKRTGVLSSESIYRELVRLKPNVVHAINADALAASARAASKLGAYLVYEAYEFWPDHSKDPALWHSEKQRIFLRDSEKNYAKNADLFITVSEYLAEMYSAEYHLATLPRVVYNAPQEIVDCPSGLHNPLRVVFAGNLAPERNLLPLIDALDGLPSVQLSFQGNGSMKSRLERYAESRGVSERVHFLELVPYDLLVNSLSQHDIGVISYENYNRHVDGALPNKLFEYLSAGLAVIATQTSAFASFEGFDAFGLLLDVPSSQKLADAFRFLLVHVDLLQKMKSESLVVAKKYAGTAQAEIIKNLYLKTLSQKPKSLSG